MEYHRRRRAAAVKYTRQKGPATLVAKGDGDVAEQILAVAREHGVPVHSDPVLSGVLARLELDDQIPGEVFVAVAAVLGFIYRLQAAEQSARAGLDTPTQSSA